jgi:hypothetical protein
MPRLFLVAVLYPAEKKLSSYFYAVAFPCGCVVSCREETKFLFLSTSRESHGIEIRT